MVLGYVVNPHLLAMLGIGLGVLLVSTMLVRWRFIRLGGRQRARYHKVLAWVLLSLAAVHALLALSFVYGWRILS